MSGRLLIVDGAAPRRARMEAGLRAARFQVAPCNDATEAAAALCEALPDVVILDLGSRNGPDAAPRAAREVRALRALAIERHGHAPPILALAAPDRADLRLAALGEGAEAAVDRATPDRLLLARIRALIRARDAERELRLPLEDGLGASAAAVSLGPLTGPVPSGPVPSGPALAAPASPGLAEAPAAFLGARPAAAAPFRDAAPGAGSGAGSGAAPGWALPPCPLRAVLLVTDQAAPEPRPADASVPTAPSPIGGSLARLDFANAEAAAALARLARLLGRELRVSREAPGDAGDGPAGLSDAAEVVPDLVLIDGRGLPGDPGASSDALRRLVELASQPGTRRAATALLLPAGAVETAALALDLGAGEVIAGPFSPDEAAARLAGLMRRRAEGLRLRERIRLHLEAAVRDPLTGLHNRRYAEPALARMAERARRAGRPLALLILDIDHFKAVNDRWGHAAGDRVLAEVARRLRAWLPEDALVARIGGEEFLVALPDTGPEGARAAADALRARISARAFPLDGIRGLGGPEATPGAISGRDAEVRVTVSVGVATGAATLGAPDEPRPEAACLDGVPSAGAPATGMPATEPCLDAHACLLDVADLLARADAALYAAKDAGRDTVALALGAA